MRRTLTFLGRTLGFSLSLWICPGQVLLAYGGKDASLDFNMLHRPGILERYHDRLVVGPVAGAARATKVYNRRPARAVAAGPAATITAVELSTHNTRGDCWTAIHGTVYNLTPFLNDHPGGANILIKYGGKDGTAAFDAAGTTAAAPAASDGLRIASVWYMRRVPTKTLWCPHTAIVIYRASKKWCAHMCRYLLLPLEGHPKDIVQSLGLEDALVIGTIDAASIQPEPKAPAKPAPRLATPALSTEAHPDEYVKPPLEHMLNLFDFEAVARDVMGSQGWAYYSSGADDEMTLRENHAAFQRVWFRCDMRYALLATSNNACVE